MPIYDYECERHGQFEVTRSMTDDSFQHCPKCRTKAKRVFTPLPTIYRVGGFYHVDSGRRFESQLTPKGREIYQKAKVKAGV